MRKPRSKSEATPAWHVAQRARHALLAVAIGAITASGCARNVFRATKLPTEYLAPEVENVQTVDLSKLSAPAVSSESIDYGDILEVTISSSYSGYADHRPLTAPVRVNDDGQAKIPLVGPLQLAGLELTSAEQAIATAAVQRGIFRDPLITVTMLQQRVNKITVLGAVNEPGIYKLPRSSSALLNAVVAAGGLSEDAGTDVELRRPARMAALPTVRPADTGNVQAQYSDEPAVVARPAASTRVNLSEAAQQGQGGFYLDDGDVVMVYKRDPHPIHVLGLVREAGEFELPVNREMRVLDALAKARGISSQVADRVHVIRQVSGREEPVVIQISLREAKTTGKGNIRLASGDIVSVEQTWATAMYDTVNNFVRFGISGSVPLF